MNPQERVQGPGIGLLVTAGVGLLWQIASAALNLLGIGLGGMSGGQDAVINIMSGAFGLFFNAVCVVFAIVIFVGARKMMRLESYGFALTASIMAIVPCTSPCCCIGLPVGIWSLVTLFDPDVKAGFQGQGPAQGMPPAPPPYPPVPPTR